MFSDMKVSVIVVCYNQAATIRRTLDSVVSQVYDAEWEVIIGDDASTDGTRAICEEYAARYPGLVRLMPPSPNKGVVDNYFDCLLAAQGEYITDCAGDDYWLTPHKLRMMSDLLDANPNANVVYSDYEIYNVDTGLRTLASANPRNVLRPGMQFAPGELLRRAIGSVNTLPYCLSASMFRLREAMAVYEQDEKMVRNRAFGCEDLPLEAALASRGDGVFLPQPTIVYNVDSASVSNGEDESKQVRFYARSLHASAVLAGYYGVAQEDLAEAYCRKSDYIVSLAFNSGNRELRDIAQSTVKEWRLSPPQKVRIQMMLMRHPALWHPARLVKLLVKRVRRLFT